MTDPERGKEPLFVDNRDGNTFAGAITPRLGILRCEGRVSPELCVASCLLQPSGCITWMAIERETAEGAGY